MPMSEMGLPAEATMVPLKETSLPGAGSSDVILINSAGDIVVVECKLAKNPEKKRTVIGQVLDYASSLTALSYDDLDARVAREHKRPLHQMMEERVPAEEWDQDQFQIAVSGTLASGRFKLVIAIDEMDPDLARILHYVSSQGKLSIFGLELRYHKQDDVEVIIPHIANPVELGAAKSTSPGRVWDAEDFRAELSKLGDDRVRVAVTDMLEFALNNAMGMYWGRAETYGTFGYRASVGNTSISMVTYYTTGTFYINLGTLHAKAPPDAFRKFVESLAKLGGFEKVHENLDGWPQFQTRDTLMDESSRTEFKEAMLALQGSMREVV
jgi:hypothetical protein